MSDGGAQQISYASAGGERVSALLVPATTPAPHAGIVFLHWGFGDRTSFRAEALAHAGCGATSLLIDAPGFGARRGPRIPNADAGTVRAYAAQLVADLGAGVDLLCRQPGVERQRLGFVGHSLGAAIAGAFLAAEPRISAAVLVAGHPEPSRLWLAKPDAEASRSLEPIDALRTLAKAQALLLFQFAERDEFIPRAAAERFVAAAKEPRAVRWYACDHACQGAAVLRERAVWLGERLALEPANDAALARVALPRAQVWKYRAIKPLLAIANRFAKPR